MTRLDVVSALSILPGGIVALGEQNINVVTIGDVKLMVEGKVDDGTLVLDDFQLWWNGYILDTDDLTISKACVGVNPGEELMENEPELTLFLTIPNSDNSEDDMDASFTSNSLGRLRSNSLNIVKEEIRKQQETISSKCSMM